MDERQKSTLRRCRVKIVKDLHIDDVWDYIDGQEIFTSVMLECFKEEKNRPAKVRAMLDNLPRRGPEAFDKFITCLQESGHGNLADTVLKEYNVVCGITQPSESPAVNVGVEPGGSGRGSQETAGRGEGDAEMMDVNQPSEMELPGNVSELHSAVQESSTPTSSSNMAANLPHPSDYSLLPSRSAAGYTGSFTEEYRMESDPRGLLLIINNRDFGGHMSNRDGSDIDCDSLKTLFLKFGFGVDVRHNLTIQEIKNSLSLLSRLDQLKTVDCLAVAILTHGSEEVIYGVDCRHMRVHDAFTPFKAENCPALHHKPKFFIVNACRGDTEDKGSLSYSVDNVTGNVTTDVEAMNSAVLTTDRIPNLKDFLIAYSTIPGHVSWRHLNDGSWFIQGLVKVFSEMAHYKDVLTMLVKVNNEVSRNVSNAGVQIPAPQVMLTKTWYLNPITKPTL